MSSLHHSPSITFIMSSLALLVSTLPSVLFNISIYAQILLAMIFAFRSSSDVPAFPVSE